MISTDTRGLGRTSARRTHRHTLLTQNLALVIVAAVGIDVALDRDTGHEGVALQAGRTNAARLVVFDTALGAPATRLGRCGARVDAVFLHARLVQGTVVVNTAFGCKIKIFLYDSE